MALFGFGKDKKETSGSLESVLAYLEDAQRLRTAITLIGPRKGELTATIQSLDEGAGTVTFQCLGTMLADKGSKVTFVYQQEALRLGATCLAAEIRPNVLVLELPDNLEVMERRAQPRARLNAKEGATLTALTGLFEGVGINGAVENISESGARIKVDKAMNLKGEKRLPLGTSLVPVGQPFMLIKVNKLPKCPGVMELEGRAVYLDAGQGGLAMGLRFDKPRADFASALRGMVGSRTTAIPTSVPPKARRKPVETPAAPPQEAPKAVAPPKAVEPAQAVEAPKAVEPAPKILVEAAPAAVAEAPAPPDSPAAPKNEALGRLKKRSRAVVALTPSAAFGDLLKEFLHEEGFGRVMVSASPEDFLDFLQLPNLGLILLDGQQGTLEALGFVRKLNETFQDLPPIILAAEEVSTSIVMAAHRSGVAQMLVKPYALDDALSEFFSQRMGC